ncbi:hypothetical protein WN943_012592 [Citrus x changshan-huyou]
MSEMVIGLWWAGVKRRKQEEVEKGGRWRISQLDTQSKHITALIKVQTCLSQSQSASLQQHAALESESEPVLT